LTVAAGEILVDARGLRCPWPVLRLVRAMRDRDGHAQVRILADDPAAPEQIAALAVERGWHIERSKGPVPGLIVTVRATP
jgi:tRNA 2-thiouridine synthesizing protein A